MVEDRLFATLDTLTREIDLGDGYRIRLTDSVGFIRKLPHHLVASFRATLEEARVADVLLHVVDVSHADWEEQMEVVEQVLADLDLQDLPVIPVFNKVDRLEGEQALLARVRALYPEGVFATAMRTDGVAEVKAALRRLMEAERRTVRIRVPVEDGARLAAVYRLGEVLSRAQRNGAYELVVRADPTDLDRLRGEGLDITD